MAYKLIAIDIDDTLLNDNHEIPPRVSSAIRRARLNGAIVVLCTGRTKRGAERFYDELGLDTLFITAGGAVVYDKDGHSVFSQYVEPLLVKQLLTYAFDRGLHPQVYIDGELVVRNRNKYAKIYEKPYGHKAIEMPDLMGMDNILTPKVLYVLDEDKVAPVQKETTAMFPKLTIKQSKPMYLEFAHPDVSKGAALRFVADAYGVNMADVIAVGDTEIDIPMIKTAGLGVAVANGYPSVHKAADIVCASSNDGGVADIIEEYILEDRK